MLDGALILWYSLTFLSIIYLTYDLIWVTPEAPVMKAGWWLVTLYTGPIGLFFYLISCKEPMEGTHEIFIAALWKQSLGSMVHCLAGDVTGIILAALVLAFFPIPMPLEIFIEYIVGFAVGLLIFQSLFMRKMMGGTYLKALQTSFYPEFLSMNMIMAGMIPVMVIWNKLDPHAYNVLSLHFWGKMSLASIVGGIVAFPINRWLVKNELKHGMMTIREEQASTSHEHMHHESHEHMHQHTRKVSTKVLLSYLLLSLLGLIIGILIAIIVG